jgi:hypothetical protein
MFTFMSMILTLAAWLAACTLAGGLIGRVRGNQLVGTFAGAWVGVASAVVVPALLTFVLT